jgi:hypothetical protein
VRHASRPEHDRRHPLLVTLRAASGVSSLRSSVVFPSLRSALARSTRAGFRVLHFSAQRDHLHLIVEADSALARSRGLQGLAIRCARAINRSAGRRGRLWSDRFHARALATPLEVRRGLVYVLLNYRKHLRAPAGVDPFSSGPWFDGWRKPPATVGASSPVAAPRTWLGARGWQRAGGLIDWNEVPAPARPPAPPRAKISAQSKGGAA